ncbi:murein hydrolase activator EnvC family protein [Spongiimicrobium salis]|uniref:murein hydrolase activator EnvC family protein n=1 Tax=Spongiimicrobium salis TaxID=1667022 RepID=UPI00374CBF38
MFSKPFYCIYTIALIFFIGGNAFAQTNEQKALQQKREQLQKEIKKINQLLFAEKKERGNVLDQMEALDKKISISQQLIRVTNQQSNLLNRQINANVRNIAKLQEDLKILKDEYAVMVQRSYQNKSKQSRLMFLLSSKNFYQAYKRAQYLKQYTDYRKEQGQQLVAKTAELKELNIELTEKRKDKDKLIAENKVVRRQLQRELDSQKALLASIRKNEKKYTRTIRKKKQEAKKIDQQIERLIRNAIAASNKKSGKRGNTSKFILTPEATIVAQNFEANKGKLIWPVERGIKSKGFGVYKDAVYPGIKHQNNGVIIATDKGASARSIFKGEVIAILSVPGGSKGVQVKHGNYISTYYNLAKVFVKQGDKVAAKTALGEVYTSRFNGQTQLKFYLYKDTKRLNPEEWVNQL